MTRKYSPWIGMWKVIFFQFNLLNQVLRNGWCLGRADIEFGFDLFIGSRRGGPKTGSFHLALTFSFHTNHHHTHYADIMEYFSNEYTLCSTFSMQFNGLGESSWACPCDIHLDLRSSRQWTCITVHAICKSPSEGQMREPVVYVSSSYCTRIAV